SDRMPIAFPRTTTPMSNVGVGGQKIPKKQPLTTNKEKLLNGISLKVTNKLQQHQQQHQQQNNRKIQQQQDKDINHDHMLIDHMKKNINRKSSTQSTQSKQQTKKASASHDDDDDQDDYDDTRVKPKNEQLKRFETDLEGNTKPLLHRLIKFVEAAPQDNPNNALKKKYKPINRLAEVELARTANSNGKKGQTAPAAKAEVLDDNVLHPPKKVIFGQDKVDTLMSWKMVRKVGSGLNNIGNTCFMNSVLQCLTYCPPLANYMLSQEHSKSCTIQGFCIFCSMERHIARSLTTHSGSITPKEIASNLKSGYPPLGIEFAPGFRLGRQEDSHEFTRFVIEGMQKVCLARFPKGALTHRDTMTTVVGSIFGGYLQSQVKCTVCNHDSNTYDPFMDLSVDINQADSLTRAMQRFVRPEVLDGSNKYKCSKCKKLVRATKRMSVHLAPPILTVQLKRFSYLGFHGGKISKPIQFDASFNLAPFMTTTTTSDAMYDLYGVLVHSGSSTNSGHYYCFIKSSSGVWHNMNDESVHQVNQATVLSQKAYILFYSRRTDGSRSTSQASSNGHRQSAADGAANTPTSSSSSSPSLSSTASGAAAAATAEAALIPQLIAHRAHSMKAQEVNGGSTASSPAITNGTNNGKKRKQPSSDEGESEVGGETKATPTTANGRSNGNGNSNGTYVKLWDDKTLDKDTQKVIEADRSKAEKVGKELASKPTTGNESSQFNFSVGQWDDADEEMVKAQKELLHNDETLKEVRHEKDAWDAEFDMGRKKKIKKRKEIDFSENKFDAQLLVNQQKKEDRLKFGDQPRDNNNGGASRKQQFNIGVPSNRPNGNGNGQRNGHGHGNGNGNGNRQQGPGGKGKFNKQAHQRPSSN
ncbi:hypothetical protein SAMD00019534_115110, partial [Acytostelium subglobosum LB1]|uniref:hypothetical protein n=1 Tax=Acytostelium subglobosum LB1 TaxID=1410327 RepID=UPI0006449A8D